MTIQMSDGQLLYKKATFKSILPFFSKGVYEQSLNKRNLLFHKSKIKVSVMLQIYVTMAAKHRTIGNFSLKTFFQKQFSYFKQTRILIFHTSDNDNQYHC